MNSLVEILNLWGTRFTAFALPMLAQSTVLAALLFALDVLLRRRSLRTVDAAAGKITVATDLDVTHGFGVLGAANSRSASGQRNGGPRVAHAWLE